MALEFIWQLPTSGDGRYGNADKRRRGERLLGTHPYSEGVTDPRGRRFNHFDYLHQVARAADLAGFDGVRIPDDPSGDDSWIVAGYLVRGTRNVKVIAEFEASWGSAVYAAKNSASFQRSSGGRFGWQIKTIENDRQRRARGDFLSDQEQQKRIEEFVTVARGVLTESRYDFEGRYFEVKDGGFQGALGSQRVPPVYLSGGSGGDFRLSAKVADVHILDAAPVAVVAHEIGILRDLARKNGRRLEFGIRLDVVARETNAEARFDAERYHLQQPPVASSTVSQDLWIGLTRETTGANATLVGSYDLVARHLNSYVVAGVSSLFLSSVPHLEEAYRLGEHVLPRVRSQISPPKRSGLGAVA